MNSETCDLRLHCECSGLLPSSQRRLSEHSVPANGEILQLSHPPQSFAIDVRGLHKSYGRSQALRGLDLQLRWGQTLTVLGANGSGKSTLIKTLATLTKPDAGEALVAGLSVRRSAHRIRRIIGVVTHDPLLYDDLTGAENLRFFARLFALEQVERRIQSVAEQLGITHRLEDKAGALSHGMRRRFSIARALLHEPLILLMDEPESGLDREALDLLARLISDKSTPYRSVLMTTHNLERGIAQADCVAILSRGRIAYESPATDAHAIRTAYNSIVATSQHSFDSSEKEH